MMLNCLACKNNFNANFYQQMAHKTANFDTNENAAFHRYDTSLLQMKYLTYSFLVFILKKNSGKK